MQVFLSENLRYHFPYREYLDYEGVTGQPPGNSFEKLCEIIGIRWSHPEIQTDREDKAEKRIQAVSLFSDFRNTINF